MHFNIWKLHISYKHTYIYRASSFFVAKTALTCQTMDLTRALKECCGIWHQGVSSRSFIRPVTHRFGLNGSDLLVQHIQ